MCFGISCLFASVCALLALETDTVTLIRHFVCYVCKVFEVFNQVRFHLIPVVDNANNETSEQRYGPVPGHS